MRLTQKLEKLAVFVQALVNIVALDKVVWILEKVLVHYAKTDVILAIRIFREVCLIKSEVCDLRKNGDGAG